MTPKEALNEIINSSKNNGLWYKLSKVVKTDGGEVMIQHDEQMQTYLRVTALRILNETAKPETMKRFFGILGYEFKTTHIITKKQ